MANENAERDSNFVTTLMGVTDDANLETRMLRVDPDTNRLLISLDGAGSGDVDGPASSTDNAIARFDGTGGKTLQNSGVIVDDSDNVSGVGSITIASDIIHAGDTDNKIAFTTDTQTFQTGGSTRMDITDSGIQLGASGARVTTVLDEDNMATDSATALATQQSIKAYVDAQSGGANTALSNLASVAINTTLVSDTDNTDALGTTAIAWSDLFLGSGGVITFNSAPSTADVTITHSADTLTFAGGTIVLGTATATSLEVGGSPVVVDSDIGVNVQAFDAVLEDLAALSPVADNEFIVGTGAGTYAHESGATARTSIGLGNVDNTSDATLIASIKDGGSAEIDAAEFGAGASTDGQVLTSDGAGGAAWEAAGGGSTNNIVFVPGASMTPLAEATFTGFGTGNAFGAITLADGVTGKTMAGCKVPVGCSGITSIKVYYNAVSTGNLRLEFVTGSANHDSAASAFSYDAGAGAAEYAGASATTALGIITVPSTSYDGLANTAEGDLVSLNIERLGGHANDTYNTTWAIIGVEFTFTAA